MAHWWSVSLAAAFQAAGHQHAIAEWLFGSPCLSLGETHKGGAEPLESAGCLTVRPLRCLLLAGPGVLLNHVRRLFRDHDHDSVRIA